MDYDDICREQHGIAKILFQIFAYMKINSVL